MRVLVVGSGGREHALAVALAVTAEVLAAPGNPGVALVGRNFDVSATDIAGLVALARREDVDLVVPGPEAPLVLGLADACLSAGIACAGPSAAAARLEGSKAFAREVAEAAGVAGPRWERFTDIVSATDFVRRRGAPIVVKADGLASGKGVVVAGSVEEAEAALAGLMAGGGACVVEECLVGEEVSLFALCDGGDAMLLGAAQDHKRLGDADTGPNTGGMGAVTPAWFGPAAQHEALRAVVLPVLAEMVRRGTPFRGVLFAGLMVTASGLRLIEFNVRLGDPEAQCLLPLLRSDLAAALLACAEGRLREAPWVLADEASAAVVLAAPGYPEAPQAGGAIGGLDQAEALPLVRIFQGGTAIGVDGTLTMSGGRVLTVQATGPDLAMARDAAYAAIARLDVPGALYRRDIGTRTLALQVAAALT
jgi:phosphoribosylamine--glycine ligase